MGHDQHGHAVTRELRYQREHLADQFGIERRGHLVEEHDLGFHRQGPDDRDALLLAARKPRGAFVLFAEKPNPIEQGARPIDRGAARFPFDQDRRLDDVLEHAHVRPEIVVLKHHADLVAQAREHGIAAEEARLRGVVDRPAIEDDFARRGKLEQVDASQERTLARTAGADDRDHVPGQDLDRDPLQHLELAEPLVNVDEPQNRLPVGLRGHRHGHSTPKWTSRGVSSGPLIGVTSWGQAENTITKFISARRTT